MVHATTAPVTSWATYSRLVPSMVLDLCRLAFLLPRHSMLTCQTSGLGIRVRSPTTYGLRDTDVLPDIGNTSLSTCSFKKGVRYCGKLFLGQQPPAPDPTSDLPIRASLLLSLLKLSTLTHLRLELLQTVPNSPMQQTVILVRKYWQNGV